ncbi:MAG: ferric reductase-like transmembrane domain-containing protein [Tannerellaceae bacterium]|jgi:DMSO/TMAO reductase YedYZ heme-binding membrane subunit|nr:ferric reductase-like transmembrane domain-containing protein [Tannerellaceae bacterium]
MVELVFKWLTFLADYCPLIVSSVVLAGVFLLLADSVKRHPLAYYIAFASPAVVYVLQQLLSSFGAGFSFQRLPVVGEIIREYVHVGGFGFPLLVIIMYVGALSPRSPHVRKILMIRKELSIISGFPILVHSYVRIVHNLPSSFGFFLDTNAYMEKNEWVKSSFGAGLNHAAYLLGIFMTILFLILWVTSFDAVRRRLGGVRWKKVQRWSYVLYAMLFLHSILLHAGGWISAGSGMSRGKDVALSGIIGLTSTCLVFGSYLVLRLRKGRGREKVSVEG